jgi:predicted RND superfamily exporter protein
VADDEKERAKGGRLLNAALAAVASFDIRHRRLILAVSALFFIASIVGMTRLQVDSNFLSDFSDDVPIRDTTIFVDEVMGGTNSYIYLFDTGVADGIKDPAVLREIERLQAEADEQRFIVKKTYSIVDLLKDINQSFHDGDPAYYALPESRDLVAQYLLLYEMSGGGEIEEYVSSDYARASLDVRCKWTASSATAEMAGNLSRYLDAHPLEASSATVTGIGALWVELIDYITQSQIRGFLLAFLAIAVMMCLLFRSVRIGMLSMVPNLAPVFLTLGSMGWMGIPLDYVRLLIAPVAIGIAVDDTIHYLVRFRLELAGGPVNKVVAMERTIHSVGRAIVITSVVLAAGFAVSMLASFNPPRYFGTLSVVTILTALAADLTLLPVLLVKVPLRLASKAAHSGTGTDEPASVDQGTVVETPPA